jgi:O-antigen/teichoic acid export membrane protein
MPLALVANVVVVRSLGQLHYAHYAVDVAAFSVAVTIINLGYPDASSQWLAAAYARNEPTEVIVRRCSGFHLLVRAPLLLAVTLVLLWHSPWYVLAIALIANLIATALDTSNVVLVSTARNARLAQVTLAMNLATQTALASGAAITHDAAWTWSVRCAGLMVGPLLGLLAVEPRWRGLVLRPLPPLPMPGGFGSYALAAWSGAIVSTLLFDRTEIFVLNWYSDLAAVALFAVATTVANQLTIPMDSLMAPLTPISAGLVAAEPERAENALSRALRANALAGALTCGVGLPLAVALLGPVFGAHYRSAAGALLALGVVSCLASVASPLRSFALAMRLTPSVVRINGVCLFVDIALAVGLVPVWGLGGAVVALAGGQALAVVLLTGLIARRLARDPRSLIVEARAFVVGPPLALIGAGIVALIGAGATAAGTALLVCVVLTVLVFGLQPRLRLPASDADAVAAALPGWLARPALTLGRSLWLVERSAVP